MARFKPYSYTQKLMIPVDLTEQLQPGTFEHALNQIVAELDLSIFDPRFHNDDTGAPAYDPAVLLKIVLFAYSRGITCSRQIARACRENVVFIALAADSRPHFSTIANFIASMKDEITPLFRNVLLICSQEGLIGKQMFAIDGCKISPNCSKEWSGTREDFTRKAGKIERSIELLLRKHRQIDSQEEREQADVDGGGDDDSDPRGGMRRKEERAIARLREKKAKIERWLAENEDKRGTQGNIKQSNVIDNESAKMPSAHGVIQGYNGIATVDGLHQVIVYAEAVGEGQEKQLLKPMLAGTRETFAALGESGDVFQEAVLVADNGYHSEENVRMVMTEDIEAYLPDNRFRQRDPDFAEAGRYRRSTDRKKTVRRKRYFSAADFTYNAAKRKLICPAGKEMYIRNRNFWTRQGYHGVTYMAKTTDCRVCGLRRRCLRKARTVARQVTVFTGRGAKETKSFTQRMIERFDTALGRFLHSRRLGIVEPVFGNIGHALGLRRFSHRGKVKVDIQWKLFCLVHNLKKVQRYGPRFAAG